MTAYALAVDVGGTKLEAALVAADGTVVDATRTRRPTGPDATPDSLREALDAVISAALAGLSSGDELLGAGVGSAGPIDRERGLIHPVNMPRARGFDLAGAVRDSASAVRGAPVRTAFGHDGGCLALAESWLGATQGAASSLSIVVSTGVGGGFVMGGRYLPGATGNAGHLGQVHAEGPLTLEEVASGPASVAWARAQGWTGERGEDLARDAAAGDRIARAAIERSAAAVGAALADASTLVDLEVVAIGGGFSRVSADYIDLVQRAVVDTAAHDYSRRTRVVRSGLEDEGPLIGAAALILRTASDDDR
ncbi:ROK family protein [Microbacterium resistens]|uniref:ROK family protein n=1 Tax=Microbacterium resistens TaxID=156977 RepID=A0ABY3RPR9_9MICO|nr:ROK family protein [Microbacterium resistens]UGS25934.1 ROK family protein [Microbacterium resistens]